MSGAKIETIINEKYYTKKPAQGFCNQVTQYS